jgi:LmbE family N-acetylglucosaminyl deacetylase
MRLLVVSPHFDDAPLSLGQSMLDGALARHDVTVGVVFARSSWVRWFHPTPRRRVLATTIRRTEEALAARRFGYRVVLGDRDEAILRLNSVDPAAYLDPSLVLTASPELDSVLRTITPWVSTHDAVLVPLGIGDHVDHRLAAAVGVQLAARGVAVGFYVDRPYGSLLTDDEQAAAATALELQLERIDVSGSITREKGRRLWYPSQFDGPFTRALAHDEKTGRREAVFATDRLVSLGALQTAV